jgi:hypothetical protein
MRIQFKIRIRFKKQFNKHREKKGSQFTFDGKRNYDVSCDKLTPAEKIKTYQCHDQEYQY